MSWTAGDKTALVLSAGGMFGAYQVGAWAALAPVFQPDIVVGTSIGALNGWAIAGGAAPEDLIRLWGDPGSTGYAKLRPTLRPWRGIFDSRAMESRIRELWTTYKPATEIGVVAVDLFRLTPRLFRDGEIDSRHLAASCAVFSCYPQIKIEGRLYTDGGLLSAVPIWAAVEMGASHIVAVNALPALPSRAVRGFVTGVRRLAPRNKGFRRSSASAQVVTIEPPGALGNLRSVMEWDRHNVERWIEAGEKDTGQIIANVGWLQPSGTRRTE